MVTGRPDESADPRFTKAAGPMAAGPSGGVDDREARVPEPRIEATFRNGTLTAISVVLGFSLSFLNRWAGLPGTWERGDLVAVAAISIGIVFQILAMSSMLPVGSLLLERYRRAVRLFLVGLGLVAIGVAVAIVGDIAGLGQNVLRG